LLFNFPAYSIALVQEEVCEEDVDHFQQWPQSSHSSKQGRQFSPWYTDEHRLVLVEHAKMVPQSDDKLATLKAYRRANGLYFTAKRSGARMTNATQRYSCIVACGAKDA
jgi:hypothetical protein